MRIEYSKEVRDAFSKNIEVVALESTIISHGMPYPKNFETAKEVENVIRDNGAIPATIAIIDGVVKIGLEEDELHYLATAKDVIKCSRRDLAYVTSKHKNGATTVSATMYLASLANIKIFVTGGIGGVHRGAETSFDISADLEELSKTNVLVVCAGAKSILDLKLTLEYLETKGVCVYGFKTTELPAFFTSKSGLKLDYKIDSFEELAKVMVAHHQLKLENGLLLCNPIKKDDEIDASLIDKAIEIAISEMDKLGIKGKEQTPYLLQKINEITEGKSLESNIKLVLNNARVGAKLAQKYNELKEEENDK